LGYVELGKCNICEKHVKTCDKRKAITCEAGHYPSGKNCI